MSDEEIDRNLIPPPILGRWLNDFNKKSLEHRIAHYERIISELQYKSPYPLHHISNHPAATYWMRMLINLKIEKLKKDYCE